MELGIGIGWRPEIAETVAALPGLDWVEVVAENVCPGHLHPSLERLRARGTRIVPHGVSLGLGGADRPSERRLADLAERALDLGSPLVSEHIAFVRAGGELTASPVLEAGHLLPVPRTRDALAVLCENVRVAQDQLPVPLALENIAALFSWPGEELTEGQFLTELVERTGVRLLIDVANLHTNRVNRGEDPAATLAALPLEALAYVHVAGGVERDGVWHDTHAHPVPPAVLDILRELRSRTAPPGVLLERDDDFPPAAELAAELETVRGAARLRERPARASGDATGVPVSVPPQPQAQAQVQPQAQTQTQAQAQAQAQAQRTTAPESAGAGDEARQALGIGQAALLSALVAGTPAPEGFDRDRLRTQTRALIAKRATVVAKLAPELPEILGDGYRRAFFTYAAARPMRAGYRRDAMDFAEELLLAGQPADARARRALTLWWEERAAARPPRRATRWARAARAFVRR
ncbi:DUF692 domain-containing protein [Streptomyces sp. NPDC057638]|uniref:DUF692 domain-containing protein n=1 Tax=Streptomyces sp. NPDC057638 TaxID=3346190 RepID=UPI0036799458